MRKIDLNQYHDEFIRAAILEGEATKNGDAKTGNRQYAILKRIFMKAQKCIDSAKLFYMNLRKNEEANVQIWACAHSLALGIGTDEAEKVLEILSKNRKIGILRLNAEMTLKVWKEQGYLKF